MKKSELKNIIKEYLNYIISTNENNNPTNKTKLKTKILSKLLGEENYFKHLETNYCIL